jgi:hypothetical protein
MIGSMAKCGIVGCEAKAIGGFKEIIEAGNFDDPNATIDGMITTWCVEHEGLRSTVRGKRGKFLTPKELGD